MSTATWMCPTCALTIVLSEVGMTCPRCRATAAEGERDRLREALEQAHRDVVQAREAATGLEANLVRANLNIGFQRGMREKAERFLATVTGDSAEKVALDMDHDGRDHSAWYRAVKAARKHLATLAAIPHTEGEASAPPKETTP